MGDLENKNPEEIEENKDLPEEKEGQKEENAKGGIPMRTYIIMALAGAYVAYLGYSLCSSVIKGTDGSSPGFMIAGIVFLVLGVAFVINGLRGYFKMTKIPKYPEEGENAEETSKVSETENRTVSDKKMSLSDRANLVSQLGDVDEDEEK